MKLPKRIPVALLVILLLLVAVRAAMPIVATRYLNHMMADLGAYRGHVDDVDLALWRGGAAVDNLKIELVEGKVPVPFVDVPRVENQISWPALFHGAVVLKVDVFQPEVNFVDGNTESETQAGRGVDWREQVERIVPISIDEVHVHDGVVRFRNFQSDPPVDLRASAVNATLRNLTNVADAQGRRVATLDATARLLGHSPLEAKASFDPFVMSDFGFALRITELQLPEFNNFAQAYGNLDFKSGNGEFVMELEAKDRKLTGYAKPLFHQIDILDWKQDVKQQHDNPLRVIWEGLTGAVQGLLHNQPTDQFATRIPISGDLGQPQTGIWSTITGILRNAFVEAFKPNFENRTQESEKIKK